MKSLFSTAGLLILIYILTGCTASQVECPPDNQPFVVHNNPEKEFPIYVTETRSEINAALDALEQLRLVQQDASTLQKLTELQNTLTNISANFETTAKPAFMSYHQNPCEANVDYFRIMNEIAHIRDLRNEFNSILENEENADEEKTLAVINTYRKKSRENGIQALQDL